jgi:hypothetical protein
MSDEPLFQDTDKEEELYGSPPTAEEPEVVAVPMAALGGGGTGSPAVGAGTPGVLPSAFASNPEADDDVSPEENSTLPS